MNFFVSVPVASLLKVGALLLLAIYVRYAHRPWLATVALTALLVYLDYDAHHPAVYLLLHGLIYLAVGGALFWAIDRSTHTALTLGLLASGIVVVLFVL